MTAGLTAPRAHSVREFPRDTDHLAGFAAKDQPSEHQEYDGTAYYCDKS
ncbi:hypothetical protein [Neisseria flavescens]|nr:hypothetical protein [Neisseria flavescens]